jgi:hypothetical protein
MRFALVALALTAPALAGAQAEIFPSPGSPQHFQVRPSSTSEYLPPPDDGPIGDYSGYPSPGTDGKNTYAPNRYHQVYRPANGLRYCPSPILCLPRRLVVFLPGHTFQPSDYTAFLETARDQGFYVIGLDYPNPHPVSSLCTSSSCYGQARDKIIFADGPFTGGGVDLDSHPQDTIIKRLKALLLYLEDHDPYGGWSTYLLDDSTAEDGVRPNYATIVFADHSGYASYVASRKQVARVVMLASVLDSTGPDSAPVSASWIDASNPTQKDRYFGIANHNDNYTTGSQTARFTRIVHNWDTLQVPSANRKTPTDPCSGSLECHMTVATDPSHASDWITLLGPLY